MASGMISIINNERGETHSGFTANQFNQNGLKGLRRAQINEIGKSQEIWNDGRGWSLGEVFPLFLFSGRAFLDSTPLEGGRDESDGSTLITSISSQPFSFSHYFSILKPNLSKTSVEGKMNGCHTTRIHSITTKQGETFTTDWLRRKGQDRKGDNLPNFLAGYQCQTLAAKSSRKIFNFYF